MEDTGNTITAKSEFIHLCDNVERNGITDLLTYLEQSDFYTAPASTRFHGSYPGGLLDHSLQVYHEFKRLLTAYPEIQCSDETAVIITLFHDICKTNMYKKELRNRKNNEGKWETYDAYTKDEKLHYGGHGSKSVFILQNYIKLTVEESVAINCHMGSWDGNDSASEAYEQFPIAWLLHVADESSTFIIKK